MNIIKRHPIVVTLVLFFFAIQIFPLSFEGKNKTTSLARFVLTLSYYPQKIVYKVTEGITYLWSNYIDLVKAKEENKKLKLLVKKLRNERFQLWEVKLQNERLKRLLEFKETIPYKTLTSNVIAGSPSLLRSQTVIIDRGEKDGIMEGMPVVNQDGIVGRVFLVGKKSAEVLLITDPISAVDAYIHRTRARGIVKGTGNGCVMEYIENESDVSTGDKVVTSGKDGFFPKGVMIGTVIDVEIKSGLIKAYIDPDADLNSLEEVFVILKTPENTVFNE